jgi:hypothetical protein
LVPKRDDPLERYKRVRKPVPKPGRAIPDRRREIEEEQRRKEAREAEDEERER